MRRPLPLLLVALLPLSAAALAAASHPAPPDATARTAAGPATTTAPAGPAVQPAAAPHVTALPAGALSPRNANYAIDVTLDTRTRTLSGRAIITWRNIARVATSELRFHLYYNAWKNTSSTWLREGLLSGRRRMRPDMGPGDFGSIDVTAIRLVGFKNQPPIDVTARQRFIAPDDGNPDDQTVLLVPLPYEVTSGETVNVDLEFKAQIPRPWSRTGAVGNYYFLAQWFPKIGVLEDTGWNCHQFHAGTEFYADYGVYDVRMTVPKGWVVGATGVERDRHDANGQTTYRYYQEDVHDFAWTTSPDYLVRTARFDHPGLPPVDLRLLLQPEHAGQASRYFDATRAALRYYGEWFGPYPYPNLTIVDPAWQSRAGGMEYPTLFTGGTRWLAPAGVTVPEGVTIHECGHQFWYALVGSNEFEHAWLDEGLNTFSTGRTVDQAYRPNYLAQRYFGGFIPYVFRDIVLSRETDENGLAAYRAAARSDVPATPSFRYWPATGGALSYDKTALWLHTLERHLGWPTLQKVLSTYFQRWKFRHPTPDDFFAVVREVSGRDLSWFFDQVHFDSRVFDYGIQTLASDPIAVTGLVDRGGRRMLVQNDRGAKPLFRTTVVVRRYGDGVFPVDVLVVFRNGEQVRESWDGRNQWKAFTYDRPARADYAVVDPDRVLLLDVNTTNNSRALEPATADAARKWMYKWMMWLQDLLLTYAFFV